MYALFGLETGLVPPTPGCEIADPDCSVACAGAGAEPKEIRTVLVSSVSPIGYSSALILKRSAAAGGVR